MQNLQMDAQVGMAFAVSQASRINTTVYQMRYPSIRYRGLVPVDTTGPEWVKSITYFSLDGVGQAEWQHAGADDVPRAELIRAKTEATVSMAAIGYGWNLEELAQAQMLGINLSDRKGQAARRASEEFIDRVAFFGDTTKGFFGITNQPGVTAVDAAATGTGSSTEWADKTPGQIMGDVNALLTGVFVDSNTVELAGVLLLPYTQMHALGTRTLNDNSETTILEWLRTNNVYTMETDQPLTIRAIRGLETVGQGGSARAVAYRNDEEVLRLNMPMPFRFFPVWQTGPFRFEVPGAFRLGGVDVSLPGAMRYMDGI
ncbi:hypothetical protein SAMN02745911_1206 [Aureimonas altamirensis DSM 21988]|uniref:DUF2184 domain-containing protein n=2 Tax=Aureimonas altamirensis TaxID=370622 RepID=A0A0P0YX35_9HYPH|nr:major capsid family protein [Aureimonas altamirensis]BAT26061.1 hypothetical protein [Aureimonas altamirensis]SHI79996.1 hypothetical protein SAMN02745911_1206 [Aureimonas altamirensis DSM 21988]